MHSAADSESRLGAYLKDNRSQGEGFPNAFIVFKRVGVLQTQISELLVEINLKDFQKLWCAHTNKGVEAMHTFCGQRRGGNFLQTSLFCLHDQNKSVFWEGRLYSSHSEL